MYHIRFIPTGNVFELPEEEVREILKNDRGNYEVLDKNFKDDVPKVVEETSTYEKVVVEKPKKRTKKEVK